MAELLLRERLLRSRLAGAPWPTPEAAVAGLLAVQSQDLLGGAWAVGLRSAASHAEVIAAYDAGRILRTHVLRPTWHFVAPADLRWLLALTAPRVHRKNARTVREVGLDVRSLARGTDRIARALEGGARTRDEIAAVLARARMPAEGLRLACLLMHAELEAVVTSGPMRGTRTTYALVERRAPEGRRRDRDEALSELVVRFLESHGPARDADLSWWSGLTLTDVRRGIEVAGRALVREGELVRPRAAPPAASRTPRARLVPNYDEHVVAFEDRSELLPEHVVRALALRSDGLFSHLVLDGGVLAGVWRRLVRPKEVVVEARLAEAPSAPLRRALEVETARFGRFLGRPARLVLR